MDSSRVLDIYEVRLKQGGVVVALLAGSCTSLTQVPDPFSAIAPYVGRAEGRSRGVAYR